MRHGLRLTGPTLLWFVGLNIDWDYLVPHCIMGWRDQWEFPTFFQTSVTVHFHSPNVLKYPVSKLWLNVLNTYELKSQHLKEYQNVSLFLMLCFGWVPANTQRSKHVIITSKRCFDVMITCLLRCVFAEVPVDFTCTSQSQCQWNDPDKCR